MVAAYDHRDPAAANIHQGGFGYEGCKRCGYRRIHGIAAYLQHRGARCRRLRVPAGYGTFHRKPSDSEIQETGRWVINPVSID